MQVSAQPTPAQAANPKNAKQAAQAASQAPTAAKMKAPMPNHAQAAAKASAAAKTQQTAQVAQQNMPKPAQQTSAASSQHGPAIKMPKSYAMVISSYEHVAQQEEIPGEAAEQLGETIEGRLKVLNKNALREIQDLPEYKQLDIDDIHELGGELEDLLQDSEDSLKAFALLKNPTFANLMESKESVHRSFADMMQDNGDEKMMFGALKTMQMVQDPPTKSVSVKA